MARHPALDGESRGVNHTNNAEDDKSYVGDPLGPGLGDASVV